MWGCGILHGGMLDDEECGKVRQYWLSRTILEGWDWTVPLPLPGEKRLQFFGNDAIEDALFRMTRGVSARRTEHTPAGKQKLVRSEQNSHTELLDILPGIPKFPR